MKRKCQTGLKTVRMYAEHGLKGQYLSYRTLSDEKSLAVSTLISKDIQYQAIIKTNHFNSKHLP